MITSLTWKMRSLIEEAEVIICRRLEMTGMGFVPQATPYLPPGIAAAGEMGSVQAPVSIPQQAPTKALHFSTSWQKSVKVHST